MLIKKLIFIFLFCQIFYSEFILADFNNNLPENIAPFENVIPQSTPTNQNINLNEKNTQNQAQSPLGSEMGNHDNNAPVFFSGKYADGSRNTGVLNLVGDAVIIQDDTTLKSDKARIFSLPGSMPSPGKNKIQRALAIGNVHILKKQTPSSPEIKASGDEAEFIVSKRILILNGKAKVWRVNEYLNGDKIKISLNSGDIEVIHPEGTIDPRAANKAFGAK